MLARSIRIACQRSFSVSAALPKGHSHWQNIKETKGKNDAAKAKIIGTLLNKAKHAAKYGLDLKLNNKLAAVQKEFKANSLNMDTFDRFLERMKNKKDFTATVDIIGPSGSLFIVEVDSDNLSKLNRELKKFFPTVNGFRFGSENIRSQFTSKGIVKISGDKASQCPLDQASDFLAHGEPLVGIQAEELAIELDCEEVNEEDGGYEFVCDVGKHALVEKALTDQGFEVEVAEIQLRPLHRIPLAESESANIERLYSILQDAEVSQVYDNIESDETPNAASESAS